MAIKKPASRADKAERRVAEALRAGIVLHWSGAYGDGTAGPYHTAVPMRATEGTGMAEYGIFGGGVRRTYDSTFSTAPSAALHLVAWIGTSNVIDALKRAAKKHGTEYVNLDTPIHWGRGPRTVEQRANPRARAAKRNPTKHQHPRMTDKTGKTWVTRSVSRGRKTPGWHDTSPLTVPFVERPTVVAKYAKKHGLTLSEARSHLKWRRDHPEDWRENPRAARRNPTVRASTRWDKRALEVEPVARAMYRGARPGTGGTSTTWIEADERAAAADAYARIEKFLAHLPAGEMVRMLHDLGKTAYKTESAAALRTRLHLALYDRMVVPTEARTNPKKKRTAKSNPRSVKLPGLLAYHGSVRPKEQAIAHVSPREYAVIRTYTTPQQRAAVLRAWGYRVDRVAYIIRGDG